MSLEALLGAEIAEQAAGVPVVPGNNGRMDQAYVNAPDGVRIEILEDKNMPWPVRYEHVHFSAPDAEIPKMAAWYAKEFGGRNEMRPNGPVVNVPGVQLRFAKSDTAQVTTKGHGLDHIGFDVKNLEDFTKKLAADGVKIDLIVRGACMLPPGLPGQTDNIRVRSVVGRFLEHSRALYFRWGDSDEEEALYLSSADWMSRNMFRRIELAWPVRDPKLRQRVIDECLVPYLHDTRDAWLQQPDGSYQRVASDGISVQQALMQLYSSRSTA